MIDGLRKVGLSEVLFETKFNVFKLDIKRGFKVSFRAVPSPEASANKYCSVGQSVWDRGSNRAESGSITRKTSTLYPGRLGDYEERVVHADAHRA